MFYVLGVVDTVILCKFKFLNEIFCFNHTSLFDTTYISTGNIKLKFKHSNDRKHTFVF